MKMKAKMKREAQEESKKSKGVMKIKRKESIVVKMIKKKTLSEKEKRFKKKI